jgi:hypothetical protein
LNLDGMRNLTAQEREAFKPLVAKYDPMLDGIAMPERYQPLAPVVTAPAATSAPAAAAAAAPEHDDEAVGDVDDDGTPPPPGVAPPGAAPAPNAAAAGAAQPAKPGGSAVYLTDKELLEAQSATDDGEVEE